MILEEGKAVPVPPLDLYIAPMGDPALRRCAVLAREIRNLDVSVEVGTERKLKRMLEIADKLAARYTLIVGDNEILTQSYTLKDMASGAQVTLTRQELLERFASNR
jgi:histidyl-tRNA synthetase